MRVRNYAMEESLDMGTSGTLVFDLDFSDPITELTLRIEGGNGSLSNKDNPIESLVSRIEIVDGGEVLYSATGIVAFAALAHIRGSVGHCYFSEAAYDTPYVSIPIRFGRKLFDPQYAFNPLAHRNPQLRITFDEAANQAAGTTGYVSDSLVLDLTAQLMEEAPAPNGFLGLREVETFTSLDNGIRRVSMPTDAVYRHLINRVYLTAIDIRNPITRYKLSADGGKFVPFDLLADRFCDLIASAKDPITYACVKKLNNATHAESWMSLDYSGQIASAQSAIVFMVDTFWPGGLTPNVVDMDGTAQDNMKALVDVIGWACHNTLVYPFGDPDIPETWFNAGLYNQLELHLTNGDADAEVNVVTEQVYPY